MCALRVHINFHFWKKKISRIEKVMIAFSISEKMFLKIESLMCALRAHVNRTLFYLFINLIKYLCILRYYTHFLHP